MEQEQFSLSQMINAKNVVVVVLALLFVAGGVWYVWFQKPVTPSALPQSVEKTTGGLGAQIFEETQNPLKSRLPETNPFSAETNPFDKNPNPFRAEYKNPFQ